MPKQTLNKDGLLKNTPDAIFTYSGDFMRPLDPDPADIRIGDIAHALSQLCRWTGHTARFYSVAEHCVLAAEMVPTHLKLAALLHDASEAYLADLARPIKKAPGLGEVYLKVEAQLEAAISARFDITAEPLAHAEIKAADEAMLRREAQRLLPTLGELMPDPVEGTPEVHCWRPNIAERRYLAAFAAYGGQA